MPRVIASIEARMGSSRLPGKVLMDVAGKPAIERLVTRLRRAKKVDGIVLATSTSPGDDVLAEWAQKAGVECHRGSEDDVLARVVEAQRKMNSEVIVEITGDCTLTDPELIDWAVETFESNRCDVVCNVRLPSFPMGLDLQVFRLADLEKVEREIHDPAVREHVSLYFYEHPEQFSVMHLLAPARWRGPDHRFMLDYAEDLRFLNEVYSRLEPRYGDAFGVEEIMAVLRNEPALVDINRHCAEKAPR
jgi:spore coat polysaccharide biosynthesis protein SpsF